MNQCPRCGGKLKSAGQTQFCRCGWSRNGGSEDAKLQKKVVSALFISACVFSALVFHLFQWGGHGLSIIAAGPEKKLEICMKLKKFQCVESAYEKLFEKTGDEKRLSQLGLLQFRKGDYAAAEKTYSRYFANGGRDYRAAHYHAHSLVQTNDIDGASARFEAILAGRKNRLLVTVMESYLTALTSHNRTEKAREVLSRAEAKAKHSPAAKMQIAKWKKQFNI